MNNKNLETGCIVSSLCDIRRAGNFKICEKSHPNCIQYRIIMEEIQEKYKERTAMINETYDIVKRNLEEL